MKIYEYPSVDQWGDIVVRPHIDTAKLNDVVKSVLDDIKANGDEAVKRYEQKFDGVALSSLAVTQLEIDEACASIDPELMSAIELAHDNIFKFHASQRFEGVKVETAPGVDCWQK